MGAMYKVSNKWREKMIIEYETSKFVKEKKQLEIPDTKNIFLSGKNPYDGLDTYFGIWNNKNTLVIVTIISWRTIYFERYLNTNLYTDSDIKKYLEQNKNVKVITKAEFKKQIDNIRSIMEI